jgi:hypothetical protein
MPPIDDEIKAAEAALKRDEAEADDDFARAEAALRRDEEALDE